MIKSSFHTLVQIMQSINCVGNYEVTPDVLLISTDTM